ncbi:hypothetical protein KSP39_PZI014391 [Platanthera zijinensis]|uniref:Uncharacterized protein n=1 Tax=Platanthera zijinensis TaxID=2320716 RepID=A0AAP0BAH9_9ASPA
MRSCARPMRSILAAFQRGPTQSIKKDFSLQPVAPPQVLRRAGLWDTGLACKEKLNHKDRDCTDWADLLGK